MFSNHTQLSSDSYLAKLNSNADNIDHIEDTIELSYHLVFYGKGNLHLYHCHNKYKVNRSQSGLSTGYRTVVVFNIFIINNGRQYGRMRRSSWVKTFRDDVDYIVCLISLY